MSAGRNQLGRFEQGNKFSRGGNPHAAQISALRAAMFESVELDDIRRVVQKIRDLALEGNVEAARLFLDRMLGKPAASLELDVALEAVTNAPPPPGLPDLEFLDVMDSLARVQIVGDAQSLAQLDAAVSELKRRRLTNGPGGGVGDASRVPVLRQAAADPLDSDPLNGHRR